MKLKVPVFNIELRYVPLIVAVVTPVISIVNNLMAISKGGAGKNGASIAVSFSKNRLIEE